MFGLASPSGRAWTTPVTCTTYSPRTPFSTACASGFASRVARHLHHARPVAQIEEDQRAVIAAAVHPTGQGHGLPDVLEPQVAAVD